MVLGDGHGAGGTVDLAGGGVDDLDDVQGAGGLEDVEGALDICVDVGVGRVVRIGDGDERGQVEDGVAVGHGSAHPMGVADVAGEDLEVTAHVRGAVVEPAPGIEGVVEHESLDLVAGAHQGLGEVGADEAVGAGDENFIAHWYRLYPFSLMMF